MRAVAGEAASSEHLHPGTLENPPTDYVFKRQATLFGRKIGGETRQWVCVRTRVLRYPEIVQLLAVQETGS